MAHKSPLATVKDTFGDKAKLVEAVEKLTNDELWVARTNKAKGLAHVSNAKLLRLHATLSHVKEKFGTRDKLIDAILELMKRSKDTGLRQKLSTWPVPRLFDTYRSTSKRLGASSAAAKAEAPAKAAPAGAKQEAAAKPAGAKKAKAKAKASEAAPAAAKKAPAAKKASAKKSER